MAYKCQDFKPGQILTAQCMNNMDEWLEYICGKEILSVTTNELGQLEITFCNGEVLNCGVVGVTVASIEESIKDGGKNIITFSDGTKVVIRNGNKGTSGVHYGADDPPSNATIWINPNGDPTTIENWEFDLDDGNTEEKTVVVLGSEDGTDSNKLPLLKVKDENGNWVEIPAIKGFDPKVEISKSEKVTTVKITTSEGVKIATINDGFDPKVAVTKSGKVTTITITDADGDKTVTLNDGVDITKVEQTTTSSEDGGTNVVTVSLSNGSEFSFNVKNGKAGYTPQKGVDYFDGTSVTVAKVTESSESGGTNVVDFSDGKSLNVKNGKDGYTPQKGVDYFDGADGNDYVITDADKAEIAEQAKASMKTDAWTATYEDGTVETIEVYVK